VPILVAVTVEEALVGLAELTARWHELGASEIIVHDIHPHELDDILALAD
jgi:hypothetical protein